MQFAIIKAGHDMRQIYQVIDEDERYVYLVNGSTRTTDRPKKKSRKHVQLIKRIPEEVLHILEETQIEENLRIERAVRVMRDQITPKVSNEQSK